MLVKAGMLFASTLGGSDTSPCTRTSVAKRGNTEKAKQGPSWNISLLLWCLTNIADLTSDLIQGSGKPLFALRRAAAAAQKHDRRSRYRQIAEIAEGFLDKLVVILELFSVAVNSGIAPRPGRPPATPARHRLPLPVDTRVGG